MATGSFLVCQLAPLAAVLITFIPHDNMRMTTTAAAKPTPNFAVIPGSDFADISET
jgi:hypothetical protein